MTAATNITIIVIIGVIALAMMAFGVRMIIRGVKDGKNKQ